MEITKKQFDDYRNFKPFGGGSQSDEYVDRPVQENTEEEVEASFSGTKAEASKILKERGFTPTDLRGKTRQQLIDML